MNKKKSYLDKLCGRRALRLVAARAEEVKPQVQAAVGPLGDVAVWGILGRLVV